MEPYPEAVPEVDGNKRPEGSGGSSFSEELDSNSPLLASAEPYMLLAFSVVLISSDSDGKNDCSTLG